MNEFEAASFYGNYDYLLQVLGVELSENVEATDTPEEI